MKKPFNIFSILNPAADVLASDSNGFCQMPEGIVYPLQNQSFSKIKQTNTMMDTLLTYLTGKRTLMSVAFVVLTFFMVHAQDSTMVHGVVVSGKNEPVSNVAVSIEGSFDLPVLTNDKGEFEVKNALHQENRLSNTSMIA